jgi:hypothetical protein
MARTIEQLDKKEVEIQEDVVQVKGKRTRVGLGGTQDILSVTFKDPAFNEKFYHYWELGDDENSPALYEKIEMLGFEFVSPDEAIVPAAKVHKSLSGKSFIRVAAGKSQTGWLYLLKQPMEFRKEDLAHELAEGKAPVSAMKRNARENSLSKFEQSYQTL